MMYIIYYYTRGNITCFGFLLFFLLLVSFYMFFDMYIYIYVCMRI